MESRVDKVAKNMKFALICQVIMVLSNFLLRRIFIVTLGEDYLGLNGLFSDILAMLSLAELGFGISIVFSLYKPVAENDQEKVKSLIRLYRNIYRIVGIFVLVVGAGLTPWLSFFVKKMPDIPESIELIYLLNVINSGASYFFIYKASLLFADQKRYIETVIVTFTKVAAALLETAVLFFTKNYILYLSIVLVGTFTQNYLVSRRVDKMYPYLKEKNIQKLSVEDTAVIKKNVGALIFHKLGSVVIFSTDSILMAKYISVAAVGLYSNYTLIKKALTSVIEPMFNGITSGMGNINVLEDDDHKYKAFLNVQFFSAWLFGFCSICLLNLFNPFISLWLGEKYCFNIINVLLIVISFYLTEMRMPVNCTKEAMGIFSKDKYKPIPECIINLVLSIVWAKQFSAAYGDEYGVAGIVLGTIASTLLVPFWVEPLVVFKYGLKRKLRGYFGRYLGYTVVTVVAGGATWLICNLLPSDIWGFIGKMMVCVIVPNGVFLLLYHRMKEFKYIKDYLMKKIKSKIKKKVL